MKENLPIVTVVTPSYNQGEFIESTILSVLEQDYPNIEYIIMDGKSTDGTLDILKKYDDRIKWFSEKDRGQSHALNKGFKIARGSVIGWLNSDDRYLPGAIANAVETFQKYPQCGLVYGNCRIIDENESICGSLVVNDYSMKGFVSSDSINICQPAAFFKKEVLEKVGYINEDLHYIMDFDLWIRFSLVTEFVKSNDFLADFRVHGSSKTIHSPFRGWPERPEVVESFFKQKDVPKSLLTEKDLIISRDYWRSGLSQFLSENYDFALKDFKKSFNFKNSVANDFQFQMKTLVSNGRFGTRKKSDFVALHKRLYDYLKEQTDYPHDNSQKVLSLTMERFYSKRGFVLKKFGLLKKYLKSPKIYFQLLRQFGLKNFMIKLKDKIVE